MTHAAVLLILDALAVFRLTRLVVADTITAPLRERLIGRKPAVTRDIDGERIMIAARPKLAEFITCPWCTSPYLAAIVVGCQALIPTLWQYPCAVLAFSAAAGLLCRTN